MHYSRSWFVQKEYKRCSWHFRYRKCVQMQAQKCNWQIHKDKCKSRQKQNLIEDDTGRGVIPNSQTHTPHSDDHRLSLMHMSWTFENFEFQIFNPPAKRSHILMTAGRHSWAFLEDLRLQLTNFKKYKLQIFSARLDIILTLAFSLTIFHQAYVWIHVSRLVR